jgi:hypothetical protein
MFSTSKALFRNLTGGGPGPTDPSFAYVPLLLNTTSTNGQQNNTFLDSGTANGGVGFTITRNGTPTQGSITPYWPNGQWSNFFNGSTDYLSAAGSLTINGQFSVECWFYKPSTASTPTGSLFAFNSNNSAYASIRIDIDGGSIDRNISLLLSTSGGGWNIGTNHALAYLKNTWNQLVVTRDASNAVRLFINGVLINTPSSLSGALYSASTTHAIGCNHLPVGPQGFFNGYISNLRLINGSIPTLYQTSSTTAGTTIFTPPTSPLSQVTNTFILTCQSNRFIDNSASPLTLTTVGTPQVTPYFYPSGFTAPAASPGAALFNGTNQYLSSPSASGGSLDITSGNFTLEAWIYPTSFNSAQSTIIGTRGVATNNWELRINPAATPANAFQFYFTGGSLVGSNVAPPLNAWSHVAAVRSSNTVTLYLNGVSVGSNASFGNGTPATSTLWIGIQQTSLTTDAFPGYIGNLRLVKGTVVYAGTSTTTPNFTPPSGPLTQTGGTYPSLTNVLTGFSAANTSLLLAMSDSNYNSATNGVQNNTFIDSSNYAFPITRNGTPTQGSITPYWPNGQWSNYIGGASNYFTGPSNAAFTLGTGDFTIEAWIFPTSSSGVQGVVGLADGASTGSCTFFYNLTANKVTLNSYLGSIATSTASITLNAWTHIAFSRASGSLKTFINGALDNTIAFADNLTKTAFVVGRSYSTLNQEYFSGYVSNVRVVKGTAVYNSAFTPSTTPLTAITNTSVLTCQSNRFKDNSVNNFTLTPSGTPRVQAFQPFSPTASYTTALYGGSGYFNGSTDYLSIPSNSAFYISSGQFTIEAWIYRFTTGKQIIIGQVQNNGLPYHGWVLSVGASGNLVFEGTNGSTLTGSSVLPLNAWVHVAAVRVTSAITLYVNGNSVGSGSPGIVDFAGSLVVGQFTFPAAGVYFNGYISNLRFVKGTAVYTANFTPPTAPVTAVTNTSLLLNMTNAGIYDAAVQNNFTSFQNAVVSLTPTPTVGTASLKVLTAGDYLVPPANPAFILGTGDFTIEAWIYPTSTANFLGVMGIGTNGTTGDLQWFYNFNGATNKVTLNGTGGTTVTSTASVPTGQWTYVAFSRASGSLKLFIGGALDKTASFADNLTKNTLVVGRSYASLNQEYFLGYIQDLRITKGVGRYNALSSIPVPTAPFPTR